MVLRRSPLLVLGTAVAVLASACVPTSDATEPLASSTSTPSPPAPSPSAEATRDPSPTPPAEPSPLPEVTTNPELRARIEGLLANPRYASTGTIAVTVVDGAGRVVLDRNGDVPLLPASTHKVVTAAAALLAFGPEHRYRTEVRSTAPIDHDGVVNGHLVLVGSGDPSLATELFGEEAYPQRPRSPLDEVADRMVAAGIRRVTGDVVGDPTVFEPEPLAEGWTDEYLGDMDAARVSGLTINQGRRLLYRGDRLLSTNSDDPALEAAARLKGLLEARGVVVEGTVRVVDRPAVGTTHTLGQVYSPPLGELLTHTVRRSDNHMADGIFRTLALHVDDTSSWSSAEVAVLDLLQRLRLDWEGTALADGSGLSRHDRLTSGLLARLDRRMTVGPWGTVWRDLMAVAGESGTLRRRLRGTLGAGAIRGKTGTLDDVRSIVGQVEAGGGRYHFAIVGNDLRGQDRWTIYELQDQIMLLLAEDLNGCRRVDLPPPSPTASPSEPDPLPPAPHFELRCAP